MGMVAKKPRVSRVHGWALRAEFAYTGGGGWLIKYYASDDSEDLAGVVLLTSDAPRHPRLTLLGPSHRKRVGQIARAYIADFEAEMMAIIKHESKQLRLVLTPGQGEQLYREQMAELKAVLSEADRAAADARSGIDPAAR